MVDGLQVMVNTNDLHTYTCLKFVHTKIIITIDTEYQSSCIECNALKVYTFKNASLT